MVITRIGQNNDLATKLRESLISLGRVVSFFRETAHDWVQPAMRGHLQDGRPRRPLAERARRPISCTR